MFGFHSLLTFCGSHVGILLARLINDVLKNFKTSEKIKKTNNKPEKNMIRDLEILINWMLKGIEYLPEISFINYLHLVNKECQN